jgi:hypothetical protein
MLLTAITLRKCAPIGMALIGVSCWSNDYQSEITAEITNGMDEMAAGTNQINIAVTRVNEISGENKSDFDNLAGEIY